MSRTPVSPVIRVPSWQDFHQKPGFSPSGLLPDPDVACIIHELTSKMLEEYTSQGLQQFRRNGGVSLTVRAEPVEAHDWQPYSLWEGCAYDKLRANGLTPW